MNKLLLFVLIVSLSSCENHINNNLIEMDKNISNIFKISLTDFNPVIDYIALEKKHDFMLSSIKLSDFSNRYILVSDRKLCLLFKRDGSFVSRIGKLGSGPGEYQRISNIRLGENDNVFIQDNSTILEYSIGGCFLKKFDQFNNSDSFSINSWMPINDSLFIGSIPNSSGSEKYKAVIYDRQNDTIQTFNNYEFLNRPGFKISSYELHANFYRFKGQICFKEMMNDTLFQLTDNNELEPKYIFRLGKYKISQNDRANLTNMDKYIHINNVYETFNSILLDCDFKSFSPAKRDKPIEMYGTISLFYTTKILGIYNKTSKQVHFAEPSKSDNALLNKGITNDHDGGPNFYPSQMIDESTVAMFLDAYQLKSHISSNTFKNSVPKYPEKKKGLKKLANSLDENDNPVLMLVKLKE